MAISLPNGFKVISTLPIDNRLMLTKAEMRAVKKPTMPNIYLCVCSDDKKIYIYDKSIAVENLDPETGRFRPIENYFTFNTAEAKSNLDEAIRSSSTVSNIVTTVGDDGSGLTKKVNDLESTVASLSLDGGEVI